MILGSQRAEVRKKKCIFRLNMCGRVQMEAINRLLKAQSGRGRGTRTPRGGEDGSRDGSMAAGGEESQMTPRTLIRLTSTIKDGDFKMSLSFPKREQDVLAAVPKTQSTSAFAEHVGRCGVKGCDRERIYRCTKKPEVGGCSLAHLKEVQQGV